MTARTLLLAAPMLASLLILGACSSNALDDGPIVATSADLHRPVVTQEIARLDIAPPYNGVSAADAGPIAAFLREHRAIGHGPLLISAPGGEGPAIADGVAAIANNMGLPAPEMALTAPVAGAAYSLSFVRYVAQIEQCGLVWESLGQMPRSEAWTNFGCATNANLAAMIADPADLIGPRVMGPADAQRGTTVLQSYRTGGEIGGEGSGSGSSGAAPAAE